jgi:hypothetical protein
MLDHRMYGPAPQGQAMAFQGARLGLHQQTDLADGVQHSETVEGVHGAGVWGHV